MHTSASVYIVGLQCGMCRTAEWKVEPVRMNTAVNLARILGDMGGIHKAWLGRWMRCRKGYPPIGGGAWGEA